MSIQLIDQLGDPLACPIISEKFLRSLINLDFRKVSTNEIRSASLKNKCRHTFIKHQKGKKPKD